MNQDYFVYRRKGIVENPDSSTPELVRSGVSKVVVPIVGKYSSMISGLRMTLSDRISSEQILKLPEIMTYHSKDFCPKEALVEEGIGVPVKSIRALEKYHAYQAPALPDTIIVSISYKVNLGDTVFQIGIRNHVPGIITVGEVERTNRYVNGSDLEDSFIENNSESGSAVVTLEGKIIGMTMGAVAPEVMGAVSVFGIMNKEIKLGKSSSWRYQRRTS